MSADFVAPAVIPAIATAMVPAAPIRTVPVTRPNRSASPLDAPSPEASTGTDPEPHWLLAISAATD